MIGARKLGLIGAAGIAVIAALLVITQALGQAGTLSVTDGNAAPGGTASVDVVSDISGEGIDVWSVAITYNTVLLDLLTWEGKLGSTCEPFASGAQSEALRVMGESESGISGPTVLATITFQCKGEGTSTLDIELESVQLTGSGEEGGILGDLVPGEFVCKEAADPTDDSPAAGLPDTGFGDGGGSGSGTAWIIVALAAAGLAGIAGFAALRVRRN